MESSGSTVRKHSGACDDVWKSKKRWRRTLSTTTTTTSGGSWMWCTMLLLLLQGLLLVHGQGPGGGSSSITSLTTSSTSTLLLEGGAGGMQSRAVDMRIQLEVLEEQAAGVVVGLIPIKDGFTYRFNDVPREFRLNGTSGEIVTAVVLDRESLTSDRFDLVILSSQPTYPIEVRIVVVDINDNAPAFPEPTIHVSFSESANAGTRVILDTATDGDAGDNDVTTNYEIVDGNEENKFKLAVTTNPSGETPYLHLETTGKLDRETQSHFRLNISAQDGGQPQLYGYLSVNISIVDVNDNPPIFDHSDYVVSLNESVPPGTTVLQVTATDNDAQENARVTYYISETETQFGVDPETGVISTMEPLNCQQSCPQLVACNKSCVFTVFARDHGNPRQDGRTYVTVNLLDANDHDPIIRFRYFPATAEFATVDENAQNGSVVAAVSVIDFDEGANGDTSVEILAGNELLHFRLEETPSFHIVRVNGVLDREKISKYNLTIGASDAGTPERASTAFLIIHVNDVNDHEPIFEKSEYAAVLSELVPVGSYVAGITATDQDTGINSNIFYAIVSGNDHQWFNMDAISGLITTRQPLDRELHDSVELRISARDGGPNPRWAYTHIKVTILDENDQRPQFVQSQHSVQLSENEPPDTLVALLTAVDHDQGTNGSISYAFDAQTEQRYAAIFALDAATGRLTTRTKLDRELMDHFRIVVVARDQGTPPLSSSAVVSLQVLDANDNSPEFYPRHYLVSVAENAVPATPVVNVTAADEDQGLNAQITYSIQSGADGVFDINPKTGLVTLRGTLNSARKASYKMTVAAKDGGGRKAVQDAVVEILVTNGNDATGRRLQFAGASAYQFAISEDASKTEAASVVGRRVGRVQVEATQGVKYSIVDGDRDGVFAIDAEKGVISTAKRIDREERDAYRLTVVARSGSAYGSVGVNVTVLDVNDNAPRFDIARTSGRLAENWPSGRQVFLARADDADDGDNSRVTYTLTLNPLDLFVMDRVSGVVRLTRPLRLELQQNIETLTLEVTATDAGEPALSSRQLVTLTIDDVNDHTPVFEYASYETSLLETIAVNERFFALTALDGDTGVNGQVSYAIVDGNGASKFGIFPDGLLYVKSALDRELKDYYALTVTAQDGGSPPRRSSVSVVIHIVDENDNAPKFSNETFAFYLPENEPPDSYVGRLTAVDVDIGRNAELTFAIVTAQSDFVVDAKSGFVKTLRYFDREKLLQTSGQDYMVLEVAVSDNGVVRLRDRTKIYVYITDVNDNAPQFLRLPYRAQVSESAAVDTQVLRVLATDADDQLNGGVFYYLNQMGNGIDDADGETQPFRIDEATGQILLSRALDRETTQRYVLSVSARDAGTPPLSTNTTVTVDVLDENDNAPEFMHSESKISVPETLAVGSQLVTFQASDADVGVNREVAFSIGAGNMHDAFRIEPLSGTLYLEKRLDYELQRSYTLNITAADAGSPRLASTITFSVNVEDANDNAPVFPSTAIVRQIQEGIPLNTPIVTVTADDPDSGVNSRIRYSLLQLEPSDWTAQGPAPHFAIRPDTGVVYVIRPIDREFADTFRLTVVATDQALPPSARMSAEKLVTVIVEDVNDNAPVFHSVNAALVPRTARRAQQLLQVRAVDADANTNGLVTYELVSGDAQLFALDRTSGRLTLRKSMPPNGLVTYQLNIRATDEAVHSQRKSSAARITIISVADELTSSVSPQFTKSVYVGSVGENEAVGTSVLTVTARYAANPLADVEYFIYNVTANGRVVPLVFSIDATTGVISTSAVLDREDGAHQYDVDVIAVVTTSATPQTSVSKVKIEVIDKNDSPPVFGEDKLVISVSEDLLIGHQVATLTASDLDTVGTITYSLVSGDDGKFMLEPTKGQLMLRDSLDRETRSEYKLTVRADDGQQYTESVIVIKVTDTNDNAPAFTEAAYSFDIPEDTGRGAFVGSVSVSDLDEGVNAQVSYTVLSDWGNDVFSLNPQSGVFTLTSRLDYEQVQHFIFVVQAQDTGRPSLSSTVTVYFNVLDLNDNAPLFDPMSYSDELYENITVASSVITVSATDQDSGDNGRLVYSISGGNENEQFQISQNGTIFTAKPLDRETQSLYNLVVMATDQAKAPEKRLSSTVQVTIILKDVNDMAPEFVTPNVSSVMENTPVNTVVMAIKAIDRDEGRNSYIEYALAPVANNRFSLGPVDGLLRVSAPLDRESRANYTLHVTAYDRGTPSRSQDWDVLVNIIDENDNSPLFDPKLYSATVSENATMGLSVLQVSATDLDAGLNGRVRYTIVGGDINLDFSIGEDSGIIRVAKNLNFERKNQYVLTIQAEDSGNDVRYDSATATITILDINDNAPAFLDSPYVAYVMEETQQLPASVVTVQAYDADSSPHNKIRYLIKDGDKSLFRINGTSGEISLLRSLDRETQSRYEITVVAMDSGSPVLTGTGTVSILVEDVNDHSPEFLMGDYRARVMENAPVGTQVTRVSAIDKDAGINALLNYTLKEGDGQFRIDSGSGFIYTRVTLDREQQSLYQLIVEAADSNSANPRATSVNVTVHIGDANDNTPLFSAASYTVYIADGTRLGQFVFGASAVDADVGPNSQILYYLSGDDTSQFNMNQDSGVIKAAATLSGGDATVYRLQIRASDNGTTPLSTTASLEIRLKPADQFPTIRSQEKPFFTFSEEVENSVFTTVSATSPKSGTAARIRYAIAGGNTGDVFDVDEETGEVSVSRGLDFETTTRYELWVAARDASTPSLASVARFLINVTDANDNSPIFDQPLYNASILEEQHPPQLVLNVRASDADAGRNGQLRYQLRGGSSADSDADDAFTIDADSGNIFTNIKLDREEVAFYTLTVEAIDQGQSPQRTGTATVSITVADKNDNPPRFTRLFSVNVTENAAIGTFVIQVTSSDRDVSVNANATYSFTENPTGKFRIDPISGNVTVAGLIDRESKEEYLLKVSAVDGSWRAETPLTITVQDQNDNAPEFEHSFYSFNLAELQRSVAFVGQVSATDRDKAGANSLVAYSLKQPSEFFSVDPASGEIFSKQMVRYKHSTKGPSPENIYTLTVVATDNGKPPLSSECLLNVHVVDGHSNAPRFRHSSFFSPVPDSILPGHKILQLQVEPTTNDHNWPFGGRNDVDAELGSRPDIDYVKVSGNGSEFFQLDKDSGWISVAAPLFGRRDLEFVLTVQALNRAAPSQFDEASVRLVVTGENRHFPVFTALSYQVIVQESEPVGSAIVSVTASDSDQGPNGAVRYAIISGNEESKFRIDPLSGAIAVNNALDFDTRQKYMLNITASDSGFESKSTTATLAVLLTDVNDNPPRFNQTNYDAYVSENAPSNSFVIDLDAVDVDSAKNSVIQYSIIGGSGKELFTVESETGVITSRVSFDFEEKSDYLLEVLAANPDSAMFGSTVVRVHITGRNEFFPKFVQPVFQYTVSESAPVGSSVGIIQATDRDSGDDGHIFYLFVGSSNDRGFHIAPETGVISVSRPLDRESQSRAVLTVMAKNRGGIRGNDTDEAQVIISIQDGNDPPVFVKSIYKAHVAESATPGTRVVSVMAVDKDVRPPNNEFTYSILGGDATNAFKIDAHTGAIETVLALDRETQSVYNITVGAIDNGTPSQTGTCQVHINIDDVNDNGPFFQPSRPLGYVFENEPSGTSVMVLRAIDADLPPNGGPFSYTLVAGEHKDFFQVERETGVVRTLRSIDREQTPQMHIVVEVSDNGTPKQTSQWPVAIDIVDKNDNPSTSRTAQLIVNIFTGKAAASGSVRLADVRPNDVDSSGQYQCRIVSGASGVFTIPSGCQLHSTQMKKAAAYSLKITGNDGSHPDVTSSLAVKLVPFDNATLHNSVTVRMLNVSGERFLTDYWKLLNDQLKAAVSSTHEARIFSLRAAEDAHVDVTLSVRHKSSVNDFWSRKQIIEMLTTVRERMRGVLNASNINIDYTPCQSTPCQNGGICSSVLYLADELEALDSPSLIIASPQLRHQLTCSCQRGFSGPSCQLRQDPCTPTPCRNGGTCSRQGSDFRCSCPAAFQGKRCELERNRACDPLPCRNGGSCQETPEGSYFCLCRPGYRGRQCELTSDSCRPNPCLNGGACENRKPGYRCICSENFYGSHCEKSSFGFDRLSYMSFPSLEASTNDISLVFSTNSRSALLLYNFGQQTGGRSDFVALEIYDGRLRFMFGGSQTAIAAISIDKVVSDGRWYRVIATRNGRVGSLSVGECLPTGESCRECRPGDRSCSADYSGPTGTLNFSNKPMYLGGIPTVEPILERPGQVHSDDFVGCIQSLSVNGRTLNLSNALQSRGITNTCHRRRDVCDAHNHKCGVGGTCVDRWSNATCVCHGGLKAPDCQAALEPISVTGGGYVEFQVSERHRRRQVLRTLYFNEQRRRRDVGDDDYSISLASRRHHRERRNVHAGSLSPRNSISVSFRTVAQFGYLLVAATNNDFTTLTLRDGVLQYNSRFGTGVMVNMSIDNREVTDGQWHNVTLLSKYRTLRLLLDGEEVGDELDMSIVHDFLDPYLTSLTLGGASSGIVNLYDNPTGFEGCMANFTINGEVQPLNGSGTIFERVIQHGRILSGCSNSIAGASTAPDPLSIGITLVIVFFVILLVAILISFVVVRVRRQQRDKKSGLQMHKQNGGPIMSASVGDPSRSLTETSDVSEDGLRSQLTQSKKLRERDVGNHREQRERPQRPDIIEREVVSKSPGVPLSRVDPDSHLSERNSGGMSGLGGLVDCEAPEHYDLENASSIAPSDIDIVYHYKGYRDGNIRKYKTNPHVPSYHKHSHRHSPHSFASPPHRESPRNLLRSSPAPGLLSGGPPGAPPRESPGVLKMQSTPLARLSPSSELSQQTPRILTLQDISGKPLQTALLATSQVGGVKDVMSASERSLNSPVSQLSQSSNSMRNSSQATKKKKKGSGSGSGTNDSMAMALGLTVEEIERLNSRPRNSSLVSTLDAVSSSSCSDDRVRSKEKLAELMETNTELLETAESSTDESGNDSFTCSEFEYENNYEKVSRDFAPSNMIFSKLAEVENENEHDNESVAKHYDGFDSFRGSLSTLVASDDDLSNISAYKPPNGSSLGWDYLLNWGPNFESLVGVFKDIAELPDSNHGRSSLPNRVLVQSKAQEEYI